MKILKTVLNWTNGKKTLTGAVLAFVLGGLYATGVIGDENYKQLLGLTEIILGIGLGHKLLKKI